MQEDVELYACCSCMAQIVGEREKQKVEQVEYSNSEVKQIK